MTAVRSLAIAILACIPAAPIIVMAETSASRAVVVAAGSPPAAERFVREPNLDRSGNDIKSIKLMPRDTVEACEQQCLEATGCVAYTFVKRSTTVPLPICWMKNSVPHGYQSDCCTSGVLKK